jgi:hypothetical protein
MPGGRLRRQDAAATALAAAALAVIAGCTSAPDRRPFPLASCPERPEPVNRDLLPECVQEDSADPGPSCVPIVARGREIARLDDARLRAYEICIPESRYATPARLRVDPGRVIVERTGTRAAGYTELEAIAFLFGDRAPSRQVEPPGGRPPARATLNLSSEPQANPCWKDEGQGGDCLQVYLQGRRPELRPLLAEIAASLPPDETCVPMQVEFGWPGGCPPPQKMIAQSAR